MATELLRWGPRILAILYAAFVSLFALDAWGTGAGFWEELAAFIVHLMPTYFVLAALVVAWSRPRVGGVLFIILATVFGAIFGRGLVRTTEDFGFQGESPSHPALLDWLAVEFMEQGWSLKHLHRLIVTSSTYRQSSAAGPELYARDPDNRLLARGPRVRLDAEQIRDSALAVSGLLSHKLGGPSVFPPQPPGVSTEGAYGALAWNVSPGEDRYLSLIHI